MFLFGAELCAVEPEEEEKEEGSAADGGSVSETVGSEAKLEPDVQMPLDPNLALSRQWALRVFRRAFPQRYDALVASLGTDERSLHAHTLSASDVHVVPPVDAEALHGPEAIALQRAASTGNGMRLLDNCEISVLCTDDVVN